MIYIYNIHHQVSVVNETIKENIHIFNLYIQNTKNGKAWQS